MNKRVLFILLSLPWAVLGQTLDYETITSSKPLKINGQISASGVYYNSNQNDSREPYTYFLQGALNVSIYSFSIPISYSFSNQGENLGYQLPFDFNRISLHPKYKWITGHIGAINMSFSPYTLNGHQFTGGGIELTPPGAFKVSAMGGRLLKAVNDDADPRTIPSYQRMGYGIKTTYEKEKLKIGLIGFYARDDQNSIDSIPEAKGVLPQENLVVSLSTEVKLSKEFTVQAEYATTAITKDLRSQPIDNPNTSPIGLLFDNRASTEYYSAIKTRLGYAAGSSSVGIGYERIDPGYETLGAYYFNNDFENITLDASNTFFGDKLTLGFNVGYQRDDLDNLKANNTNRTVGAVNATLTLSERLTLSGNYSNFTTFTNIKPNQFDEINDADLLDEPVEDLDYRQLSQSANLTVNYILSNKKTSRQNLSLNYNLNDVANEQGGIVRIGDASTFHNLNLSHTIQLSERDFTINTAVNGTYNTIGREEATTWGPTLSLNKRFLDKKLNTRFSAGYNQANNATSSTQVTNLRAVASYVLKEQHNFNLSAIQLFRSGGANGPLNELTATFGYNYAFGLKKPTLKRKDKKKRTKTPNDSIQVHYKQYRYTGLPRDITPQLIALPDQQEFATLIQDQQQLTVLEAQLLETQEKNKKIYKEVAITYLKTLGTYIDFTTFYNDKLYQAYQQLLAEANAIDRQLRYELTVVSGKLNSTTEKAPKDLERQAVLTKRYDAHTQLLAALAAWELTPETIANSQDTLQTLKKRNAKKIFEMYTNGVPDTKIIKYLEIRLADVFHKVLKE